MARLFSKVFAQGLLFGFIALLCLTCYSCCTFTTNRSSIEDPGVAVLLDYNVALVNDKQRPYCGGTVVRHDQSNKVAYVATALHCVVDVSGLPDEYTFIKVGQRIIRVTIETMQRESDLALLKTEPTVEHILVAPLATSTPQAGQYIWIVGSGAGVEDILSHGTMAKPRVLSKWSNVLVDIIDGSAFYGNSGGGVYNDNLELIGVLIEVGPQGPVGSGLWAYSVNIEEIQRLLSGLVITIQ